jgi:predicted amidohydrolase
MKIGICQTLPEFGEIKQNVNNACRILRNMEADLVVLPELFNSGYQFVSKKEAKTLAEEVPQGFTTQTLMEVAKEKAFHIVAGLPEKEGSKVFISAILVGPSGHQGTYRKSHLFFEEKLCFDPGDTGFSVHDIGMAKIGMIICFDWIFPEATRILALKGAQIICQPANLVFTLCQNAMVVRAIENRVFTITANRVGWEQRNGKKRLTFTGLSQAADPEGNRLFQLSSDQEETYIIEIDPDRALNKLFTEHNHLFWDRRVNLYGELLIDKYDEEEKK